VHRERTQESEHLFALPNPLVSTAQTAASPASAPKDAAQQPESVAATMRDPAAASAGASALATAPAPGASPAPVDAATVLLTYQGPSWTEIRDKSGQLLISRLVTSGSVEPVNGTPPFDIVLGNARAVTLVFRGKSVELSPYTRRGVARLTLQ
jgi:cytoskeleton protein RodZ